MRISLATTLTGANFTDAYMKGADFSDAKGIRTKLGARSLADANFSRVTLNFPESDWYLILAQ